MDQKERRLFLIKTLLSERPQYRGIEIPGEDVGQRRLLRSLLNVRMPEPVCDEFLEVRTHIYRRSLQAEESPGLLT